MQTTSKVMMMSEAHHAQRVDIRRPSAAARRSIQLNDVSSIGTNNIDNDGNLSGSSDGEREEDDEEDSEDTMAMSWAPLASVSEKHRHQLAKPRVAQRNKQQPPAAVALAQEYRNQYAMLRLLPQPTAQVDNNNKGSTPTKATSPAAVGEQR
jgi:hypothetical protein